jgi:serine phosphatase RsbU (regulator of sigma subunit)
MDSAPDDEPPDPRVPRGPVPAEPVAPVREGVALAGPDDRLTYVDPAVARMLGRAADDLLGRSVWELFPAGDAPTAWEIRRGRAGQSAPLTISSSVPGTGSRLTVSLFPVPDGTVAHYRVVPEDQAALAPASAAPERAVTSGDWAEQVMAALAQAVTFADVVAAVGQLRRALGAVFSTVLRLGAHGYWERSSADTDVGALAAAWSRLPRLGTFPNSDLPTLMGPRLESRREDLLADRPQYRPLVDVGGLQATALVPLFAGERRVGALLLAWTAVREFPDAERERLTRVAERLALAVDRTAQYDSQLADLRTMAKAFQPARLPEVPGVEVAARYRPVAADRGVGGDWYDLTVLSDGRLSFVIGDVVGHGPAAAVTMNELRHAARGELLRGESPSQVAARLSAELLVAGDEEGLATALIGVLDPATRRLSWTSAGHMPPLLVRPTGLSTAEDWFSSRGHASYLERDHGPMLGVRAGARYRTGSLVLPPGGALILYTDGLLECRSVPLPARLAQFARLAERHRLAGAPAAGYPGGRGQLQDACDAVLADLSGAGDQHDDLCLVALRVAG